MTLASIYHRKLIKFKTEEDKTHLLACFNSFAKFNYDNEGKGEPVKRENWKKLAEILNIDPSWTPQAINPSKTSKELAKPKKSKLLPIRTS